MPPKRDLALLGKVISFNWNELISKQAKDFFDGKPPSKQVHAVVAEFKKTTAVKSDKWICHIVEFEEIIDLPRRVASKATVISDVAPLSLLLQPMLDRMQELPGGKSKFPFRIDSIVDNLFFFLCFLYHRN